MEGLPASAIVEGLSATSLATNQSQIIAESFEAFCCNPNASWAVNNTPSWLDTCCLQYNYRYNLSYVCDNSSYSEVNCSSSAEEQGNTDYSAAVFLFGLIFFVGLTGNLMFCYIVSSSSAMKTVTNYFLVNLAVADILICIFAIPLKIVHILFEFKWPFPPWFCYIVSFIQPLAVFGSSFTLIVISVERYINILHPLKLRLTTRHSKLVIAVIWVISSAFCVPDVILVDPVRLVDPAGPYCTIDNNVSWSPVIHWVFLTFQFFLPVLIMAYCYSMMAVTIWRKEDFGEVQSIQMLARKKKMIKSKKKIVKMLMVVVSVYTLSYLPLNTVWIIIDHLPIGMQRSEVFGYIHTCFLWFALSHTCYNPVIYFWMNTTVRHGFKEMVGSIPGVRKCFPNVNWDGPFSRSATASRHLASYRMVPNTVQTNHGRNLNNRNGAKISTSSMGDIMEPSQRRKEWEQRHKFSVTSMSTLICESDIALTELAGIDMDSPSIKPATSRKTSRTRVSVVTIPDLAVANPIQEELSEDVID